MLNDEFHKDPQLTNSLDQYEVVMPNQLINFKKSRWQRFIQSLAYPTKDPLEPICTSSVGFTLLKIVPLVSAIFMTILQILLQ